MRVDQRRTHHHAVGQAGDAGGVCLAADAEADVQRRSMGTQRDEGLFDAFQNHIYSSNKAPTQSNTC